MEEKKSRKADLERGRGLRFLIGLTMAFLCFIAVLHLPTEVIDNEEDIEDSEEFQLDMDIYPTADLGNLALLPAAENKTPSTDRIEIDNVSSKEHEGKQLVNELRFSPDETDDAANLNAGLLGSDKHNDQQNTTADENPLNFRLVEKIPEFPGGIAAFMKWLSANLHYPVAAKNAKKEGKVVVSFIVNRDGTTTDYKIEKSAHPLLDREALRVVKLMPKWEPGIENDEPCRTLFAIPIIFKL